MEIVPGIGLPLVQLGQTLKDIEAAVGPAVVVGSQSAFWEAGSPAFSAYFDTEGTCDLIEMYATAGSGEGVTLDGVQLVGRLMSDVVEDLRRAGLDGQSTCLTVDYREGFMLWSLGELMPEHGMGAVGSDTVVEGVAISHLHRSAQRTLIQPARQSRW